MMTDILFFAIIACFLLFRLYQVLGQRGGHERRPEDSYLHQRLHAASEPKIGSKLDVTIDDKPTEPETGVPGQLTQIKMADRSFSEGHFLRGARGAFEIIVKAFTDGDKSTLQPLLDPPVYQSFCHTIDARKQAGQKLETTIVRLRDPDITQAKIQGDSIYITVHFASEQITVLRDKDNVVIDGDPDRIYDVTDIWVFRRQVGAQTTNWFLTETDNDGQP